MRFTAKEEKVIARLRKSERQWRWFRWALLGLSLLCLSVFGYIAVSLYNRLHWDNLSTYDCFLVALYWPKLLLLVLLGAWLSIWPLSSWQGNATRMLLLKLVDAHMEETSGEQKG